MENTTQKTKLYLISHTHWDREWYQTFQRYRFRLVRMMDDLLDNLERDPDYKVFHLDGQTIVLQDYLDIRPENEERLRRLIAQGRIIIGPWYVMPDEFLVSGEALIKNLQIGHAICAQYGAKPMRNGYVTDIFGHNSQFPQILNGFDIHSATLYRGIGNYPKDAFCWQSPDGSNVTVAKLDPERSYSNFYFAVRWPFEGRELDEEDAVRRMRELVDYSKTMAVSNLIVMMDGVDHIGMEPQIPALIRLFEQRLPDVEFVHTSIEAYFNDLAKQEVKLETIQGPLYQLGYTGVNNQLLKNVLSSMVHLKQQNDGCERLLAGFAEPLNAFTQVLAPKLRREKDDYDLAPRRRYLDKAWEYLLQNQPHDSICGCSLGEVHQDNEYRFRQAADIASLLNEDCLDQIARNIRAQDMGNGATLLYNPSQLEYSGIVLCDLLVPEQNSSNLRFYGPAGNELDVQVLGSEPEMRVTHGVRQLVGFVPMKRLHAAIKGLTLPALGYAAVTCRAYKERYIDPQKFSYAFEEDNPPKRLAGSLFCAHNTIYNGPLLVRVQNGALTVTDKRTGRVYENLLTFEDCGDVGEGWNYRKPAYDRVVYSGPCQVSVESDGPLAAVLRLTHTLRLPAKAGQSLAGRSEAETEQQVTTFVTVAKGDPCLHFSTQMDNHVENHRLRVLFPTGYHTNSFFTKLPFDMQRWPIAHEDSSQSREPDTLVHPSQGITYLQDEQDARNALGVYTRGLYEVEVTDNEERAVALTLMRAAQSETGTLTPSGIQMQRQLCFQYGLRFGDESPLQALLHGEQARASLLSRYFTPRSGGELEPSAALLTLQCSHQALSTVVQQEQEPGALTVRLYDVSGAQEEAVLRLPVDAKEAWLVNLKGDHLAPLAVENGGVTVPCRPHAITTVWIKYR